MFHFTYIARELRRRIGRTVLTALGLALGVGLVIGIIGVSQGLDEAQNHVLAPLSSVGTDILVTRVTGGATSGATTTTTAPGNAVPFGGGDGGPLGGGGGGFFGGGGRSAQLNVADTAALVGENRNVVTDLSKLGKPGTKFSHDFFLSPSLQSFAQDAVGLVAKVPGVTSAVPGLSQNVQHRTGTVPEIVAEITTGGQTYTQTSRPAPMTDAERQAFIDCLASKGVTIGRQGSGGGGFGGGGQGGGGGGSTPTSTPGGGGDRRGGFVFGGGNPAFEDCQPARFQEFRAQVVVPQQVIRQVVNPPQTDIAEKGYTAAGVDPAREHAGLVTIDQITKGHWFDKGAKNEVLVNVAYANIEKLDVGSKLSVNGTSYSVVALVRPTLTGSNSADVYFPLATLQNLATKQNRVTQILVKVDSAGNVDKVAAAIKQQLPGADVSTSKALADQVTGSLADTRSLAHHLGGALAAIVLIAAFVIAALLTLSSIGKRVREIGTLRAIGWSKARVVRQLLGETLGIAFVGGVLGLLAGVGVAAAVRVLSPTLKATVSAQQLSSSAQALGFVQNTAAQTTNIALRAPLHTSTLLLGLVFALIGGLVAGLVGSWRAARLAPATALRNIG